jgi:hypothetical protein
MPKLDPKLEKWIRWLTTIEQEVQALVMAKDIFWSLQSQIKANRAIQQPSIFYWYMGNTYVAYALTGIRRLVKPQKDSISLKQLLTEIVQAPEKVSRQYYGSLYTTDKAHFADKHFDAFCASPGDPHISATMVKDDMNKLVAAATNSEDLADKRIAHRDTRAPAILPTFKEADWAIETLHELCLKYRLVLLADCWATLLPTYQYDWQQIFDHPWRKALVDGSRTLPNAT